MKLNLLPTHVSKGNQFIPGVIIAVIIVVVAALLAVQMKAVSVAARDKAFYAAEDMKPHAQQAVDMAASADQIIAGVAGEIININLMHQMDNHNKVYPEFYDKLFKSIPNYFRITSISAVPNGNDTCTVTMNGVIHTFQQYADIMLALLRVQGAQSITRSGYNLEETIVPPLTPEDQKGIPIKPGIPHLPSKKLDQLDILIGAAHEDGFTGTGGFGTFGIPRTRGAMPHWSAITIGLVMNANLQTPDPLATLDNNKAAYKLQGSRPQVQLAAATTNHAPPAGKAPTPAPAKPGAAPAGARPGPAIVRPGGGPAIAKPGGGPPAGARPGPGGVRPGPAGARPGPAVPKPGGGK